MSSVLETHRKAMEWADKGQLLRDRGDESDARDAFHRAMKLEREAAFAAGDTEPDRSVLLRSAGSLALDCNELRAAEQLFAMGLAGDPPDEIAEEIRDLLEQVHSVPEGMMSDIVRRGGRIELKDIVRAED